MQQSFDDAEDQRGGKTPAIAAVNNTYWSRFNKRTYPKNATGYPQNGVTSRIWRYYRRAISPNRITHDTLRMWSNSIF